MQSMNSVHSCTTGVHRFSKNVGPHQNYRCWEGNMKDFPYWGCTGITRHNM